MEEWRRGETSREWTGGYERGREDEIKGGRLQRERGGKNWKETRAKRKVKGEKEIHEIERSRMERKCKEKTRQDEEERITEKLMLKDETTNNFKTFNPMYTTQ